MKTTVLSRPMFQYEAVTRTLNTA